MDDHDDVFFDIGLSEGGGVQSRQPRPPDLWKVFVCMLLDARVYCNGVMQSIVKAVELP